jgi:hypothetical protein
MIRIERDPFLKQLRGEREFHARLLADCESGTFRLHHGQVNGPLVDITDEHAARLRRIIGELDELIADMGRPDA